MACLRNLAIGVLSRAGPVNLAAALRPMPATHADYSPTSESPSDETDNTQERRSLGVAGCALRFDQSLAESRSAQELVDKTMVLHGDLGNPYTLWTAAQGVFEQGASS